MRTLPVILFILILCSCKSLKTIEVPVETVKKEYVTDIRYDSIYIKDIVDRYVRGDTVFIDKQSVVYRYKQKIDTVVRIDSIPYVIKVEVEKVVKVNEIYWWQKTLMWLGGGLLLCIIILVIRKFK